VTRRVPSVGTSLPQLAGWLFADLLLVMVLVVLGGQTGAGAPVAAASPSASATGSSTRPRPTATQPPGLDPNSVSVTAHVDAAALIAGSGPARADLRTQVLHLIAHYLNRHAALVIVWGTAADCGSCGVDIGLSQQLAQSVAPLVPGFDPTFFPAYNPKIIRAYFDGSGTPGTVRFELFFIT
jgi:hypothetical protein